MRSFTNNLGLLAVEQAFWQQVISSHVADTSALTGIRSPYLLVIASPHFARTNCAPPDGGHATMLRKNLMRHVRTRLIMLTAAALLIPFASAQAFDDTLYPAFTGQWTRFVMPGAVGFPPFDPKKPPAQGQEPPLTREYQAKFEATLAERAARGLSDVVSETCLAPGMPMMMQAYEPMQITVLPETTYILIDHIHDSHRRIFTDGRDWPKLVELPQPLSRSASTSTRRIRTCFTTRSLSSIMH